MTLDGTHDRLIDRTTELAQLRRIVRDTRDGRGRIVFLTGPPGVGKTALGRALLSELRTARDAGTALLARCVPDLSVHRPYGPFRDLAGALAASGAADTLEEARDAAPAWFGDHEPAARRAFLDEFLDLCRRLAERGTTAFLIDDLQWVDRSSVDLLGHLASALDDLPVLLLVTHEPVDGRRGLSVRDLERRLGSNAMELMVSVLDDGSIEEMTETLLGGSVAGRFRGWVTEVARGNPQHAESLVRGLQARGVVRRRLLKYSVPERDLPDPAPDLTAAVAALLDAHEPNVRWTLEAAALAGPLIDPDVVAAQVGDETGVIGRLRAAVDGGILEPAGPEAGSADRARFRFRSPIARDLLASGITPKRRTRLIERAAEALAERLGQGAWNDVDAVAALYMAIDHEEGVREWSVRAADLCERLYAPHELETHLRAALRVTTGPAERLDLERRLAETYAATGREPEAEGLLEGVLERSRELDDVSTEARAGALLGWMRLERGEDPATLSALAAQLVDRARATEDPEALVPALDFSCVVAERVGRAEEALLMAEEALHVADTSGKIELEGQAAFRLARVHVSWGHPHEGRNLAERALELFERMGLDAGIVECHALLGMADFRGGEWDGALEHWRTALGRLAAMGTPQQRIGMRANIADLLTRRGEFDRARELYQMGLREAEESGDSDASLRCQVGLARLDYERGEFARVLELTDRIREALSESGAWREDFHTTALRALSYLELGDEVQAWHEAARLEQLYQGKEGWFENRAEGDAVRIRVIDLDSDHWLAGMVAEQGIGETADKDVYGEAFLQYHRACVLARSDPADARTAVERAVEVFDRLGATPMLDRARRLQAELPEDGQAPLEAGGDEDEITDEKLDQWFDSLEG